MHFGAHFLHEIKILKMEFEMFRPVCMNILLVDFPPIQARRS